MQKKTFSLEVGGKTMTAEFSDLADQAHGAVIVRYGNTAVMATAVMSEKQRLDIDYFPLTVEYEERFYAAGQILGSRFVRREGRPSEDAILSGRVVDRTIRPLFDWSMRNEVQVILTVLAIDEDDPDVVAVNAASLALATSDIPWGGPVAAVRLAVTAAGETIVNPTYAQRRASDTALATLACGRDSTINMVEVEGKEVAETAVAKTFEHAVEEHNKIIAWQESIVREVGKQKRVVEKTEAPEALRKLFAEAYASKLPSVVIAGEPGKGKISALKKAFVKQVGEVLPDVKPSTAEHYFEDEVDRCLHTEAVENGRRADGRGFDEVRPLYAQAGGVSSVLHGSGIFYRGGTHVFTALTLGGPGDSLLVDTMEEQEAKRHFMHHYNFPPFSVGETGRVGGLNRRMVGHGALAEKALLPMIPPKEEFPYTIRLVSECMASNGSTSMASVCASSLALMDGGVPLKRPIAGIAMGLLMSPQYAKDKKYKILTDIQGPEDHFGDMDFKVAGTSAGITAIQLDIKLGGIPVPILTEALEAAKKARLEILEVLSKAIAAPRPSISPRAPEILVLTVKKDQIGLVIGPGGKTINGIRDLTKVDDITIEEDGTIFITGKNGSAGQARDMIAELTHEYTAGETFEGEVTRIMDFGAFVRIGKNAEGLVHISEIAPFRVAKVTDALSEGEKVRVIIKEIDDKNRINLSIKAVDPDFATRKGVTPAPPMSNGGKTFGERRNHGERR